MGFELGPVAAAAGYQLLAFEKAGSTNAEALNRARLGIEGPLWITAREQSAGRGRRGRTWETPTGNLAASLLLTLNATRPQAATLGFVAGLALNEAVSAVAPGIAVRVGVDGLDEPRTRLTLKWPNDVLADGAKLAGILLEVEPSGDRLAVVIGLGVNVAAAPAGLPYPATALNELGSFVTAEGLFTALTDAWVRFHLIWDGGRGLAEIRRLWLAQAAGLGAPVAVRIGDSVLRGKFETLDEEGRLIVLTDDGERRAVTAGEVHFGAAASLAS
ncbi:biotin--[acetyl-CoA-carboxylase] ligase [Terrihabitans soli]|uniref:biotin--[biotin carboxyl-carrier protein] ligase n=1 Tax=Terrihabitans soli TaxID=708113 RepID=A0A6S6QT21_9HYPH|nr:biotin--[acetyl-CoA-carboxylase] ligase [Terrihabitans soli]BCJ90755.1 biotin--[acetyl-CoA-carboxylase] ligase [Terrihabitans soli]